MPTPAKAVAVAPPSKKTALVTLDAALTQMLPAIKKALPRGLEGERLIRVVMTEVQKKPELLECTKASMGRALLQSAALGLYPDSILGHSYLVPFENKGVKEIQLIVGYKGLIQLTLRSNQIASVFATVVYEGEEFQCELGDQPRLKHVPLIKGPRGPRLAAYAIAMFKDKDVPPMWKVLTAEDVQARRGRSRAKDRGPWVTDTDAMWAKSAVRALAPFLPLSPEDARVVELADAIDDEERAAEVGDFIDLEALDLESAHAAAATAQKQEELKKKYTTTDPQPAREPGDEDVTVHPCCGTPAAGPHKEGCPNVE